MLSKSVLPVYLLYYRNEINLKWNLVFNTTSGPGTFQLATFPYRTWHLSMFFSSPSPSSVPFPAFHCLPYFKVLLNSKAQQFGFALCLHCNPSSFSPHMTSQSIFLNKVSSFPKKSSGASWSHFQHSVGLTDAWKTSAYLCVCLFRLTDFRILIKMNFLVTLVVLRRE